MKEGRTLRRQVRHHPEILPNRLPWNGPPGARVLSRCLRPTVATSCRNSHSRRNFQKDGRQHDRLGPGARTMSPTVSRYTKITTMRRIYRNGDIN